MIAMEPIREEAIPERVRPRETAPKTSPAGRPKPLARKEARDRLSLIVSLLLCVGVALFLVSRYATLVVANYEVQNLQASLAGQNAQNASLRGVVYQLSSPTRIMAIAEGALKMKPATPVVVGTSKH